MTKYKKPKPVKTKIKQQATKATKEADDQDAPPAKKAKIVPKQIKQIKPGLKGKNGKPVKKEPLPKETAQSRKERKLYRKKQKPNYELSCKAKKIWEKLRIQKSELSKTEKSQLVDELMTLVKENDKQLINLCFAHDTSRVLQTCLKQGLRDQRHFIFNELNTHVFEMCMDGYAKNIVWKMLKYGTPQERENVISSFKGKVYHLLRNSKSASVVEYAYNNYATAQQRDMMVRQLYGKVFTQCDNSSMASLSQILSDQAEKKESILSSFKEAFDPLAEKAVIKYTIVHKALYDFFQHCDDPKITTEMIEVLRESLIHMMHSHDGAHVTMKCLWYGTKKDRKVIIKTMKEFILKLSGEEFGHLAILAALDCVDDTVILKKALVQPLIKGLSELTGNKYGRKVLLYLMSPRNPSHFLPETVKLLSSGDDNATSKKPMEQRHRELSEAASPGIIKYVAEKIDELIFDHSLFVLIENAVLCCYGDTSPIIDAIIQLLAKDFEPNTKDENDHFHIVEDPCGHMTVKRLLVAESKAKQEDENKESTFSQSILDKIPSDNLASWCKCNRGTQILLALIESNDDTVSKKTKKILKPHVKAIKKITSVKSTKILIQKMT